MESYEEILSRMREQYESESGHAVTAVSDTDLRLRVMAGEVYRLGAELDWLRRQSSPCSAQGVWLDRHGELRGVSRKGARRAKGTIAFSRYLPLSFDAVIPKGTVCATTGEAPVEYVTTEEVTLTSGSLTVNVPAQAVLPGAAGNVGAGQISAIVTPLDVANYITNPAPFAGGSEKEEDEPYRIRVMRAFSLPANALNSAWYRDVALRAEGIGAAQVVPRENGANTVGVYVWGQDGAPSEQAVAALRETFHESRDVGVTVAVSAAAAKTVNILMRIKLTAEADFDLAARDAKAAVALYFAGLTVGSGMRVIELQRALLRDRAIVKIEFPTSVHDLTAAKGVIPLLGTVTVEEIS